MNNPRSLAQAVALAALLAYYTECSRGNFRRYVRARHARFAAIGRRGFHRNVTPFALTAPTVAGVTVRGQTLTVTPGTYGGVPTPTVTHQWQRNGVDIAGATSTTYVLVAADDSKNVRVAETAASSAGSVSQNSVGVVIAPAYLTDDTEWFAHADLGVTDIGGEVTDIVSQGGGGTDYDLAQSTGTLRMDIIAVDPNWNGRASFHCDAGDVMVAAGGNGVYWELLDGTGFSVRGALRSEATGLTNIIGTDDPENGGIALRPNTGASTSRIRVSDDTNPTELDNMTQLTINTVHVLSAQMIGAVSPSDDSLEGSLDNTPSGSPTLADIVGVSQAGTESFIVGARLESGANGFNGSWTTGHYMKRTETAQEITDWFAWFNDYWGQSI